MNMQYSTSVSKLVEAGFRSDMTNALEINSSDKKNICIDLPNTPSEALEQLINQADHSLRNKTSHTALDKKGDGINENSSH